MPIPGTRSPERVEENIAAVDLELVPADLDRIHEILPAGGFGDRYANGGVPVWD